MEEPNQDWNKEIMKEVLLAAVKEQRAGRRWGIFFKLVFLCIILIPVLFFMSGDGGPLAHAKRHTALIKVSDELSATGAASAETIIAALMDAFKNPYADAVIIELNSPGGSPVQAGEIYDEIIRLRAEVPSKKVYGVITDTCASGCYYIAAATDEIYANEASLVGSIGVLFDGFGLVGTLDKVGAQRRLITAGKNKAFLDPFTPLSPEQETFMHDLLEIVHVQFINKVKARRGNKLTQDDTIFSGLVWTGQQSVALGLVDGIASVRKVAAEIVGEPNLIDYSPSGGFLDGFTPKKIGMALKGLFLETEHPNDLKMR